MENEEVKYLIDMINNMDIKDKLRLAICMSQSKWSGLIYNNTKNYEKFDEMLKDIDEEYRTTLINFGKYKLVMFAMAKLMEMETTEQNKVGNLCIAGHNFDDDRFFSKLSLLDVGDIIKIYAPANVCVYYKVYEMYEIEKNDMSCTSQDTNGKKEVTLITCNNINQKRFIVKAKEFM